MRAIGNFLRQKTTYLLVLRNYRVRKCNQRETQQASPWHTLNAAEIQRTLPVSAAARAEAPNTASPTPPVSSDQRQVNRRTNWPTISEQSRRLMRQRTTAFGRSSSKRNKQSWQPYQILSRGQISLDHNSPKQWCPRKSQTVGSPSTREQVNR